MAKLLELTSGKKTYVLAGCTVLYAVLGFFLHKVSGQAAAQEVWTALLAAGLRHGMK